MTEMDECVSSAGSVWNRFTVRYQMYCTYYYCLTVLFLLVITKWFLWECCFRGLFFKTCCICESDYLSQKFSSLGRFEETTVKQTKRHKLSDDVRSPFFLLLSVCPVQLVRHWCHSCALCHLKFEGWSGTHHRHRVLMCVLEQNKMLQLHLSCFGFYIQSTKKRELFKTTTSI